MAEMAGWQGGPGRWVNQGCRNGCRGGGDVGDGLAGGLAWAAEVAGVL